MGQRGWSVAAANAALDRLVTDYPYTKLHIGDPGANGTGNPAVNTTRVALSWAAAAGGTKANSGTGEGWPNVPAAEDYTDFTQWSAPTGGAFGGSGTITANPLAAGDDAEVTPGAFVLTANNIAS